MAPAILSTSTLGHQYLCSGRFSLRQGLWAPTLSRTLKPSATSPARALPGVGRLPPRGRTSVVWASRAPAAAVENKVEERDVDGRQEKGRILRVGIICGGPSEERGISLNSARSVLDHIQGEDVHVYCYYIDINMNAYAISSAQLYSNTPADFDFKLESLAQGFPSLKEFTEHLASSVDIVFPVIHGRFGEDGGVQGLLEKASIPFVGTESKECEKAFDKYNASIELRKHGFVTVPNFLIKEGCVSELSKWFTDNQLDTISGKVVVKPSRAGSSIGVTIAYGVHDTLNKANNIMLKGIDDKVLVEIFLEGGSEFTAIVVDVGTASDCCPVTLLPTEVELQPYNNKAEDDIFNYRRKYLPTQQVAYHTPPRYPIEVIDYIRQGAAMLFQLFGLRDFARVDGWFLPSSASKLLPLENKKVFGDTKFGTIVFTDINLISGMEQTSFLFQQASKVGFSHSNVLRTITRHACSRFPSLLSFCNYSKIPEQQLQPAKAEKQYLEECHLQKVFVIFGGETSERQVSLMSGTNIWLNLQAFGDLDVIPCLLTPVDGYVSLSHRKGMPMQNSRTVWRLPYSLVLRHTTEEVYAACIEAIEPNRATITADLRSQVMDELLNGLSKHKWFGGFDIIDNFPMKFTLEEWIRKAKESQAVVFIAVHGGIGEDGTLQSLLESAGVPYTGPGILASKTCVDKVKTSLAVHHLADQGVLTIPKDVRSKENLINADALDLWHNITTCLKSKSVCVKPASDGCSTGVARLCSVDDLSIYVKALTECVPQISANTLSKAHGVIEMPSPPPEFLIFEPFIETDEITFSTKLENGNARKLIWKGCNEWVEVTVGIMGKRGMMHSLTPSVTVKESGDILSLEEKFQGGTGINLTPPPKTIVSEVALQRCKQRIEMIANALDLEGFSRIDAFINVHSGEVLVIEVNTVPGMTPSTVLIHQALAEEPPMYPHTFFRTALDLALQRTKCGSRLEVDGLRQ